MPAKRQTKPRRKLLEIDEDIFTALKQLAERRMATLQELIDEALVDILKKHRQPVGFAESLKQSLRDKPANDDRGPAKKHRKK